MQEIHSYLSSGVAVVLGALFAGVYTSYLNHLASKNDIIKDYLSDLLAVEILCAKYWLFDDSADPEKCKSHEIIGHELRAKIDSTSSYTELSRSILGKRYEQFETLDVQLFMVATGGYFQTNNFKKSPETYSEIIKIITEMRKLLRERRNAMFWSK